MKLFLDGKEISDYTYDWEAGEGAWFVSATYLDGTELSENELQELSDTYQEELYENAYINAQAAAYDAWKDRMKYGE